MNLLKTALTYAALFCVGAVTSVACFEPDLSNPSFRCNPAQAIAEGDNGCPGEETCCSDDPATVGGKLPNYHVPNENNATYGTPLFSNNNNALSTQGMCVKTGEFFSPLINGCPVPCNPTWDQDQITKICGDQGTQCCQTQELDPIKDCIMVDGRWRAVRGEDVIAGRTGWGDAHATNQDPFATGCNTFSGGATDPLRDCIGQLSAANQRGFCYSLGCPCIEDVCEQKNNDYVSRCTAPAAPGV